MLRKTNKQKRTEANIHPEQHDVLAKPTKNISLTKAIAFGESVGRVST
jgi:hypothetical protein